MKRPDYDSLLMSGLKRKLDAAEEAQLLTYLADRPDARAAWEEEASLNRLLRELPDTPVPANFTAQIVRLAERDLELDGGFHRARWWGWLA